MKKKTWCISLLLTLCLLFCSIPVQAASGWNSSWGGGYRSAVTLKRGKTVTSYLSRTERVKLKVPGSGYKWSSSNKKCATVSSSGVAVYKKNGSTIITAKKGKAVYKCKLITESPRAGKAVSTMTAGKTYQYSIYGTKQKITWRSSNKSIVSIDSKGKATAKRSGYVTITATFGTYHFESYVNVNPKPVVVKTYTLGQTWTVPGQWSLRINSVTEMSERNPYSDVYPDAVYLVDYTYENLGYTSNSMDGLFIDLCSIDSKIIDSQGYVGYEYPNSPTYYPQEIPVGAKCHAQSCIGVEHKGNLKIYMDMYAGNNYSKKYSAIFNIKVN